MSNVAPEFPDEQQLLGAGHFNAAVYNQFNNSPRLIRDEPLLGYPGRLLLPVSIARENVEAMAGKPAPNLQGLQPFLYMYGRDFWNAAEDTGERPVVSWGAGIVFAELRPIRLVSTDESATIPDDVRAYHQFGTIGSKSSLVSAHNRTGDTRANVRLTNQGSPYSTPSIPVDIEAAVVAVRQAKPHPLEGINRLVQTVDYERQRAGLQ